MKCVMKFNIKLISLIENDLNFVITYPANSLVHIAYSCAWKRTIPILHHVWLIPETTSSLQLG